jgi:hypothetical protein
MIKFPDTIPGRNRPEATAHGARRPATRGRPKSWLGHGLAAQPSGTTGLRDLLQRASAARAGGEGALVGGDSGCGILQHRCERGELGLAPIWE